MSRCQFVHAHDPDRERKHVSRGAEDDEGEKNIFSHFPGRLAGCAKLRRMQRLQGDELFKPTPDSCDFDIASPDGHEIYDIIGTRKLCAEMSKLRRKQSYSMLKLTSLVEC